MRRVTDHLPRRRWLAWMLLLAGLLMLGTAYELGQINAGHNRLRALERERGLSQELAAAKAENRQLREQVAVLETSAKVKAEAYRQVEARLTKLQARIQQQSEDIAFYQGIVGADQQAGLRVQDLKIEPGAGPDQYRLRLVLAQALRNDARIAGRVQLAVEGEQDGQPRTLELEELTGGAARTLDFSFRYFQNLQAELSFPRGFDPRRITVRLLPRGKNPRNVEESFDWRPAAG